PNPDMKKFNSRLVVPTIEGTFVKLMNVALHKNWPSAVQTNHESTKGRNHERNPHGMELFFVFSSFRAFVMEFLCKADECLFFLTLLSLLTGARHAYSLPAHRNRCHHPGAGVRSH